MTQNSINNSIKTGFGNAMLTGIKFPSAFLGNAGSGDVDLYTVPANKTAAVIAITGFNTAGTTTTVIPKFKNSGTYYPYSVSNSASTNQVMGQSSGTVLNAGEILAVNTTQAGMNLWGYIVEFDSNSPLKKVFVSSLASGDNTIYTVPTGKSAKILGSLTNTTFAQSTSSYSQPTVYYYNASGGTRTINAFFVPSGGSSGSTNKIKNNVSVLDNTLSQITCPDTLNSGDSIVINTNSSNATQLVWIYLVEA